MTVGYLGPYHGGEPIPYAMSSLPVPIHASTEIEALPIGARLEELVA